jgi:hypothetical protein
MTTYDIIISSGMEIGEYGHVAVYVARTETDADGQAEHDIVWVGEQRSVPVEEGDRLAVETLLAGDLAEAMRQVPHAEWAEDQTRTDAGYGGWRVLTGRSAA